MTGIGDSHRTRRLQPLRGWAEKRLEEIRVEKELALAEIDRLTAEIEEHQAEIVRLEAKRDAGELEPGT